MMPSRLATCSVAFLFAAGLSCGGCQSTKDEQGASRGGDQLRSALAQSEDSIVGGQGAVTSRDAANGDDAAAGADDRSELISKIEEFLARTQEFDSGEVGAQPVRKGAARDSMAAGASGPEGSRAGDGGLTDRRPREFASAPPRSADRAGATRGADSDAIASDAWHRRGGGDARPIVSSNGAVDASPSDASISSSRVPAVTVRRPDAGRSAREVSYGPAIPIIESVRVRESDDLPAGVSVRSSSEPVARRGSPGRSDGGAADVLMTNQALGASAPRGPATLGDVLPELEQRAADRGDFDAMWKLSLAKLAAGADPTALPPGHGVSEQADVVLRSFAMLGREVRDALVDPRSDGLGVVSALDGLGESMLVRLDPVISNMALCTKVTTFGVYEELPPEALIAGRAVHAVVYSEIDYLTSERGADGLYESRLATRLELFTAEGKSLWHQEEPEIRDSCRRRRRDFFVAQRMTLPPTLPVGDYVLKLTVEDLSSGRMTERVHPVRLELAESVARSSGILP